MRQFNPPHPGGLIRRIYLEPHGLSSNSVARALHVNPSTFNRLINERADVTPDMAIRLSRVLGRSPESWLKLQDSYDLWHAQQRNDHSDLKRMELA